MSTRIPHLVGALILLGPVTAAAQDAPSRSRFDSVLRVLRLPRTTAEAREQGVPGSRIDTVIDVLRRGRVPAADAQEILEAEVKATAEGQPAANFGAFVQQQHHAGLSGRALADAVHREQARRAVGRAKSRGAMAADTGQAGAERGARGRRPDTAAGTPAGGRGRRPDTTATRHQPTAPRERRP